MDHDFAAIAAEHFGIEAAAHPLPGEIDRNVRLRTPAGTSYVLRLSPPDTEAAVLDFQADILRALGGLDEIGVPQMKTATNGETVVLLPSGWLARLFTWVPGVSYASAGRPSAAAGSIGRTAGAIVTALSGLDHPSADRKLTWDLRNTAATIEQNAWAIPEPRRRRLVNEIAHRTDGLPLAALPTQVIHNDVNDENVLVENGRVVGIIDVGDAIRSVRVGEAAIAATYAMLDQDDPVTVGAEVIRGFAAVVSISEEEVAVLLDLILARLATSVAVSARRGDANPHHVASEPLAWDLLERLAAADTAAINSEFVGAAGLHRFAGPRRVELLAVRASRLGRSLSLSYEEPLHVVRGAGVYLFDGRGRRYLDAVNNVAHVGHSNPRVVAAASDQMAVLNTNTRYLHGEVLRYADRLAATLPEPLEVVYLVNSGSEANELALRLARTATGARDVLCLDHGYHGNTSTLIEVSPYKFKGPGGSGPPEWVGVLPSPDPYRNEAFRGPDAAAHYRSAADEVLSGRSSAPAALIAESLPGCAGQIVPAEGVLGAAYDAVRERGGVVIADEVQAGFGRVGSSFWSFELHGVVPDVVTMGKPIGNGHPIGAVVTTRAVARAFETGMEYFNTFGGNPVSAAVANTVLDVIEGDALQENALLVGTELMAALRAITERDARIGDLRGAGLFLGVELVADHHSRRPAPELTRGVVEYAKSEGVLLSIDGPNANVIKIKPPLVFSSENAARVASVIGDALRHET
jgi:4-aminobutyrate aminotransferase-like enzyme/Ser/Thr protein kinase RdoA (MazF antagonist)